jgi:seryl-tRNA synthetase
MSAITFDTLKLAKGLESSGFTHEQAVGAAEVLSETIGDAATPEDALELKSDISELKHDIATLKISQAKTSAKIDMLQWMVGAVGVGVLMLVLRTFWSLAPTTTVLQ